MRMQSLLASAMLVSLPATAQNLLADLNEGENCEVSSIYADYQAPKRLASVGGEIIEGPSAEVLASEQHATWTWLNEFAVNGDKMATISLSESDLMAIGAIDCPQCDLLKAQERRVQVGVSKNVGVTVDLSNHVKAMVDTGQGMMWSSSISSPGASAMRMEVRDFNMPKGAELYVFNSHGEAFGPYSGMGPNGNGHFWTNSITGDNLRMAIRLPKEGDKALGETFMTIATVGHMGPRFRIARNIAPAEVGDKAFCSFNESCVNNANCGSTNNAVNDARLAVAHMIYQSGPSYYICSGGLLNDTDNSSVRPLFLTANHCLSTNSEAASLEAIFDFDTPCGGNCDQYAQNTSNYPIRTNGSSVLSTSGTSDYTLLELSQTPGGTRAYLGWTNSAVAFSNNTPLYRISHPSGAPQAYSEHSVDTSKGTCGSWPRGNWIYSHDENGATEGGSSGSPVVNSSGQVVGQLSGGCGTNVNDTCDNINNATVDGALAAYFNNVAQYLDPSVGGNDPTMHVHSIVPKLRRRNALAQVFIRDENGAKISGATVTGTFSNGASGTKSGTTNSKGKVTLKSNRANGISSFDFCVDNVTHGTLVYDDGSNVETCDGI